MSNLLSLVVPVYYEAECIDQFIAETRVVLASLPIRHEFVFVDDGSDDDTVGKIRGHAETDQRIKLVELSYNQGKQAAVTAGISYARGDYILYMDPDLQDPPEEIPRFLAEIEKGYDLVFGIRRQKRDSLLNRVYSRLFWGTLNRFTGLQVPTGLAVMRIFNRAFADRFLEYREQNRFIEGIFMHIGMKRSVIEIEQRERFAGVSKFNFRRKMSLAFDAILDFSELPLRMSMRFGLGLSFGSLVAIVVILVMKMMHLDFRAGWPSLISALMFGFGMQLFFIGIAAVYIGRIYRETKSRPLYSIREVTNLDGPGKQSSGSATERRPSAMV
ncbi:dolichol-phosphate mannosyltransferase [Luteimonas cucumeris]|uniref:Dolichol-phosphate mannosyltransferase n=1 Tax=Luteimonas cucumeris TaxID=985012 RepID=A0A562L5M8_9GAMM|nr:glycosyltransferase family 2 protein [Luteimonas cucumeris]TWI02970.1 dolichol-phosphate mannosyltransferase [Luteimonas cucumeris]